VTTPPPALTPLIGQWRLIEFTMEIQQTREKKPAWGANPKGRLVILPSAYMIAIVTPPDSPSPSTVDPKAPAFRPTIAYSGRVEIEGDQMKVNVDVSNNEVLVNTVQARAFKCVGNNLLLISPWGPIPNTPDIICRGLLEWVREA
jgi:Lipocalin-like domain